MRKQEEPSKRALATRAWREKETEDQRAVRVLKYTLYNHRMTMEQYTALRLEQADRSGACKEPLRFGETRAVTVDQDKGKADLVWQVCQGAALLTLQPSHRIL